MTIGAWWSTRSSIAVTAVRMGESGSRGGSERERAISAEISTSENGVRTNPRDEPPRPLSPAPTHGAPVAAFPRCFRARPPRDFRVLAGSWLSGIRPRRRALGRGAAAFLGPARAPLQTPPALAALRQEQPLAPLRQQRGLKGEIPAPLRRPRYNDRHRLAAFHRGPRKPLRVGREIEMDNFSRRHGYAPGDADICVREDAPHELRGVIVDIAYEAGLSPHSVRSVVCQILRRREDPSNWSALPNVDGEVREHLDSCEWYEVYDVIEALAAEINDPAKFEHEVNAYFRRRGIGWQLAAGRIQTRGAEAFERTVSDAREALAADSRATAAQECTKPFKIFLAVQSPTSPGAFSTLWPPWNALLET